MDFTRFVNTPELKIIANVCKQFYGYVSDNAFPELIQVLLDIKKGCSVPFSRFEFLGDDIPRDVEPITYNSDANINWNVLEHFHIRPITFVSVPIL